MVAAATAVLAALPGFGSAAEGGRIALSITGASGAAFAGTCAVGAGSKEETLRLDGRVPFTVEIETERLNCRITTDGALTVEARKAGNVTRTTTSGGTINLRLE